MGLDMFVFRARRPTVDMNLIYDSQNAPGNLTMEEKDINLSAYQQLKPYCEKIRILRHDINYEKIAKDNGLEKVRLVGQFDDFYLFEDGEIEEDLAKTCVDIMNHDYASYISIFQEDMDKKYSIPREDVAYVTELEEVLYWRKEFEVRDWFHYSLQTRIENTGFYILDEKIINKYNKKYKDKQLPESTKDTALFYHEWY